MKNKLLANLTPGELQEEDFLKPMALSQYRLAKDIPRRSLITQDAGARQRTAQDGERDGQLGMGGRILSGVEWFAVVSQVANRGVRQMGKGKHPPCPLSRSDLRW